MTRPALKRDVNLKVFLNLGGAEQGWGGVLGGKMTLGGNTGRSGVERPENNLERLKRREVEKKKRPGIWKRAFSDRFERGCCDPFVSLTSETGGKGQDQRIGDKS